LSASIERFNKLAQALKDGDPAEGIVPVTDPNWSVFLGASLIGSNDYGCFSICCAQ